MTGLRSFFYDLAVSREQEEGLLLFPIILLLGIIDLVILFLAILFQGIINNFIISLVLVFISSSYLFLFKKRYQFLMKLIIQDLSPCRRPCCLRVFWIEDFSSRSWGISGRIRSLAPLLPRPLPIRYRNFLIIINPVIMERLTHQL